MSGPRFQRPPVALKRCYALVLPNAGVVVVAGHKIGEPAPLFPRKDV